MPSRIYAFRPMSFCERFRLALAFLLIAGVSLGEHKISELKKRLESRPFRRRSRR